MSKSKFLVHLPLPVLLCLHLIAGLLDPPHHLLVPTFGNFVSLTQINCSKKHFLSDIFRYQKLLNILFCHKPTTKHTGSTY
jgi:hypothetical protein